MRIEDFLTQVDAILEEIKTTHIVSIKERARGQLKDHYNKFKEFEKQNEEKEPGSKATNILLKLNLIFNMFDCSRLLYKKQDFTSYNRTDIQGWLNEATELLKQLWTDCEDSKSEPLKKDYAIFNMKNKTQQAILSVCQYLPVRRGRTSPQKTGFFNVYCERFIELNNFICSLDIALVNNNALQPVIIHCLDTLFKTYLKDEYKDPFTEMEAYQKKLYNKSNNCQIYIEKWDALITSLQQVSAKTGYIIPKFVRHPATTHTSLNNSKKRKKSPTSDEDSQPLLKLEIPPVRFDLTLEPSDSPNSTSSSSLLRSPGSSIPKISPRSSSLILSPPKPGLSSSTKKPRILSKSPPIPVNSAPPIKPVSPLRLGKSPSTSSSLSSSSSSSGFPPVSPLRPSKSPSASSPLSSSSSSSGFLPVSPLRLGKSPSASSPLSSFSSSSSSPVLSNPSGSFSSSFTKVQQIFQGLEMNEKKLTEQLKTALSDNDKKDKEIEKLNREKSNIQAKLGSSFKEIKTVKRSQEDSVQKVKQLTAELSQNKDNIKNNEITIKNLNIKITDLEKTHKTTSQLHESKAASLLEQLTQKQKLAQELQQALEKERKNTTFLTKSLEEEVNQTASLNTELLKLQKTIYNLKEEKETIDFKLTDLTKSLEEEVKQTASLKAELLKLQKTIDNLKEDKEIIDFKLTEKELQEVGYLEKISILAKQLKSAAEKSSEQSDTLIKLQQETKDQLEQAKTEFKGTLDVAARRYNGKEEALNKQREKNHRLKEKLENSTESYEKQIDGLKKQVTNLIQELEESKYKLDKEEAATLVFHQENARLREEIARLREENDKLKQELEQKTQEHQQATQYYQNANRLFTAERVKNTKLRKDLEKYAKGSKSSSQNSEGGYRPHIFKLAHNTKTENLSSSSNSQTLNKGNGS
jgi:hypothetical protein